MRDVFICDAARTPIGRYGGALAKVRTDDLAAVPIKALVARNNKADWSRLDEVFLGCANQSGEDNRNVARMALLLAGLPDSIPGVTVNRLCASGLNAVGDAARAIRSRRDGLRHCRRRRIDDAGAVRDGQGRRSIFALGGDLRHHARLALHQSALESAIRRRLHGRNGRERRRGISGHARRSGRFRAALAAARRQGHRHRLFRQGDCSGPDTGQAKNGPSVVDEDEHPRPDTTIENLQKLKTIARTPGTVTAGNASGINDGAAAIILASEEAVKAHGLTPRARVLGMASAGVPPRIMGIGPVPSTKKLLERLGLKIGDFDVIELNEAFAAQGLAVLRQLGVADDFRSRQSARRRHRARPSARHVRRAADADGRARPGKVPRQARARDHVRRRRAGRVAGGGKSLNKLTVIPRCPAFAGHDT